MHISYGAMYRLLDLKAMLRSNLLLRTAKILFFFSICHDFALKRCSRKILSGTVWSPSDSHIAMVLVKNVVLG